MKILARLERHPCWALAIFGYLTALLIDPGNLGSIDTARRLIITHSLWKGTAAADPADYPSFAFKGKGESLHYPYGLGQPLLMLPADVVADQVAKVLDPDQKVQKRFRNTIVSLLTFPFLCALTIPLSYRFLLRLGFTRREAVGGAVSLLLATSLLHYTQVHHENSLLLLLLLLILDSAYEWSRSGSRRSLLVASSAGAYLLLVRVTAGMDLMVVAALSLALLPWNGTRMERHALLRSRLVDFGLIVVPCLLAFIAIDRGYQWIRFGDLKSTYIHLWADHQRAAFPEKHLSPAFPFSNTFWDGFTGQTIRIYKSTFIYDPLILLTVPLLGFGWRRLGREVKCVILASIALLLAYIVFYSRCVWLGGDIAWGNRYVTHPAELVSLFAVPLFIRFRRSLPGITRMTALLLIALSVYVQIESTALSPLVEPTQKYGEGREIFVPGWRTLNIVAVATGNYDLWGLSHPPLDDDFLRIPMYLPFRIQHAYPGKISKIVWAAWITLAVVYFILFLPLLRAAVGPRTPPVASVAGAGSAFPDQPREIPGGDPLEHVDYSGNGHHPPRSFSVGTTARSVNPPERGADLKSGYLPPNEDRGSAKI